MHIFYLYMRYIFIPYINTHFYFYVNLFLILYIYLHLKKKRQLSTFSRDPFFQSLAILNKIPRITGCQEFLNCSLKHDLSSVRFKDMKNW